MRLFGDKKKVHEEPGAELNPSKDIVSCGECACLVYRYDAQEVDGLYSRLYYCKTHRKPYSRVQYAHPLSGTIGKIRYYGEVEMTEDGMPVKKK